jgi:hypothetical protein
VNKNSSMMCTCAVYHACLLGDNGDAMKPHPARQQGTSSDPTHNPATAWIQRQYARITAVAGGLLLCVGVMAVVFAPVALRGTVVIVTVLFGFAGALLVFMALESARMQPHADASAQPRHNAPLRAALGAGFGLTLTLAGLAAPFLLSASSADADARFLFMMGFAPVALTGTMLTYVFWRRLQASQSVQRHAANTEPADDQMGSPMVARIAVLSGALLLICAIGIALLRTAASGADLLPTAAGVGGVGLILLLAGLALSLRTAARPVRGAEVRRAPVQRIPRSAAYRLALPIAIGLLLVLLCVVLAVVVVATLTPLIQ